MSLRKQSFWGIAIKAANIGMGFLVVAVLARILSPEDYGIYSVVMATVMVLTVPTALGLPNYVVRETAKATGDGNGILVRRIVAAAGVLVLLVSVVVLALTAGWTALGEDGATYRATMWVGLWLIPVMALNQILGGALRGIGQNGPGLLLALVLRPMLFLLLLLGWIWIMGMPGPGLSMGLHVGGAVLAFCFGMACWLIYRPKMQARSESAETTTTTTTPAGGDRVNLREMLMSTGVMGIIAGVQTLNANLSIIMLGALASAEAAGLYQLGSAAAMLTVAGLQAINMVTMPHFARAHREGNHQALQNLATRSVRLILVTAIPAALLLLVAGRQIIEIAFGPEYLDSYTPMVILVIGQLVSASFGSVVTILNMTGHERDTMKVVLLASLINIALNYLLIPRYGAEGAAYATAIVVVFWNVILHLMTRKRLSINTLPFSLRDRP